MDDQIQAAPQVAQFSSGLPLDSILLIIFLCFLAGYIIYSVILHYHWQQYSANKKMTATTFITYAVVTLPLVLLMALTAFTY